MVVEAVDYQAVLLDLKTRRARLDQLIAGIEATIMGQPEASNAIEIESGGSNGASPISGTIHPDTFFGLSLIEASKKFLRMAKRAQHTGTIAEALSTGGLKRPTDAVLSSILVRAAKGREITKVSRGMWGLSEWYPKASKDASDAPQRKARKGKKAAKAKRQAPAAPSRQAAPSAVKSTGNRKSEGGGVSDLIIDVLREAGKPLAPKDILKQLAARGREAKGGTLGICLYRHVQAGRVQKNATANTYGLAESAAA